MKNFTLANCLTNNKKRIFLVFLLVTALSSLTTLSAGIITIWNPAVGVNWVTGSTHEITWYDDITQPVKIELLNTSDVVVWTITASTPSTGTFTWNLTGYTPGSYKIKITSTYNPATTATSGIFSIIGSDPNGMITIWNPAVGVEWITGSTQNITWWDNLAENVDIELYTAAGADVGWIVNPSGGTPSDGTEAWTILNGPGDYKIKISSHTNPAIFVWSGNFKIVASNPSQYITVYNPALGVQWATGSIHDITWMDNVSGDVKIELLNTSNVPVWTIAPSVPSTGTYTWNLTGYTPGSYKIKISSVDYPSTYVISGIFSITDSNPNGMITIWNPAVGVEWITGSTQNITWWDNLAENVDIELYTAAGADVGWIVNPSGGTPSDGTEAWTILNGPGDYKIKISSHTNPAIFVWSGNFKIILDGKKSGNTESDAQKAITYTIYPNPTTNVLNIESDYCINHVWLFNTFGKAMFEKELNSSSIQFDVSILNPGIYILKLVADGTITTRKIVIQ